MDFLRSNSSPLPHSVCQNVNCVARSVSLHSAETGKGDLGFRVRVGCIFYLGLFIATKPLVGHFEWWFSKGIPPKNP